MLLPFAGLACPLDNQPLLLTNNAYCCVSGHCFDISKYGYVNLLPVQLKKSKYPGDNKEMVLARHKFLSSGMYSPVAGTLCELINDEIKNKQKFSIIDAGCGEGYYTSIIKDYIKQRIPKKTASLFGFDISKDAIQTASKLHKEILWAVATNNKIPVLNNSADILTSLFSFPVLSEFYRILKQNGLLVIASSGTNHLIELRQKIYTTVKKKEVSPISSPFFHLEKNVLLQKTLPITPENLDLLLKMTPHFYRMDKDTYTQLQEKPIEQITVDIHLTTYRVNK